MRWNLKGRLAYVGGLLVLGLGALSLISAPPVGIAIVLLGLYVFPPTRRRLRIDVSPRRLVVWCGSVLLILFGLITALKSPFPGALAVGAGLLALPPLRAQIQQRGDIELRGSVVAVVVLVAAASSMWLVAAELNEPAERGNVTHSMNESFTVNAKDEGKLRVNVTDAELLTGAVPAGRETPVTPTDNVFLVTYVTFENVGNDTVTVAGRSIRNVELVDASHSQSYNPSFQAQTLGVTNRLDARPLALYDHDTELEPGEQVHGAVVYSVDLDQKYELKFSPRSDQVDGDNHYVPIEPDQVLLKPA